MALRRAQSYLRRDSQEPTILPKGDRKEGIRCPTGRIAALSGNIASRTVGFPAIRLAFLDLIDIL